MAARGHGSYESRSIQAPGMMRHGPFPAAVGPAGLHRPLEPLPSLEHLEHKMTSQAAEIERLLRENKKLAATNVAMKQEIGANQQEMQKIKSHIGSIQTESDIQVRGLLEKIRRMDDDIRAGEMVRMELQQVHAEAQSLITSRHELTGEIQHLTEELQKAGGDGKQLLDLLAELDGLRQEHQKLRAVFERGKGSNTEQVEQLRAMEKNLISLAGEIEKLRAEVTNAEKVECAENQHAGTHGGGHPNSGHVHHGSPTGYTRPSSDEKTAFQGHESSWEWEQR